MYLYGKGFKTTVGIEIVNGYAFARLYEGLMFGKSHIDELMAVFDGLFNIGVNESAVIVDAFDLPDDVIAFLQVVEYRIQSL